MSNLDKLAITILTFVVVVVYIALGLWCSERVLECKQGSGRMDVSKDRIPMLCEGGKQ
jgi:hypothetical protein